MTHSLLSGYNFGLARDERADGGTSQGFINESTTMNAGNFFILGPRIYAGLHMKPETTFYQFSKEVWQTVNDQAMNALLRKEFCPEESRIEAIRCVHLDEEVEADFGRQIWFFEASGVDPIGRRQRLYGALDFSVQFGLLEPARAMLMNEPVQRQRFLQSVVRPHEARVWAAPSTKIWVRLTLASVLILSSIWLLSLAAWMMNR